MQHRSNLSPKQRQVLDSITRFLAEYGRPPSYREIAQDLGVSAVGTVQDHLRALRHKGFLDPQAPSKTRTPKARAPRRPVRLTHQSAALSVPVLGTVPAGPPIEAIEERIGTLSFASPLGSREAVSAMDAVFALRVQGDSMEGAGILDGDYVIVQKAQTARHGQIVVALVDGEATVKRLEILPGRMRLLPENPKYAPIEIPPSGVSFIQGRVVGVQRFL